MVESWNLLSSSQIEGTVSSNRTSPRFGPTTAALVASWCARWHSISETHAKIGYSLPESPAGCWTKQCTYKRRLGTTEARHSDWNEPNEAWGKQKNFQASIIRSWNSQQNVVLHDCHAWLTDVCFVKTAPSFQLRCSKFGTFCETPNTRSNSKVHNRSENTIGLSSCFASFCGSLHAHVYLYGKRVLKKRHFDGCIPPARVYRYLCGWTGLLECTRSFVMIEVTLVKMRSGKWWVHISAENGESQRVVGDHRDVRVHPRDSDWSARTAARRETAVWSGELWQRWGSQTTDGRFSFYFVLPGHVPDRSLLLNQKISEDQGQSQTTWTCTFLQFLYCVLLASWESFCCLGRTVELSTWTLLTTWVSFRCKWRWSRRMSRWCDSCWRWRTWSSETRCCTPSTEEISQLLMFFWNGTSSKTQHKTQNLFFHRFCLRLCLWFCWFHIPPCRLVLVRIQVIRASKVLWFFADLTKPSKSKMSSKALILQDTWNQWCWPAWETIIRPYCSCWNEGTSWDHPRKTKHQVCFSQDYEIPLTLQLQSSHW